MRMIACLACLAALVSYSGARADEPFDNADAGGAATGAGTTTTPASPHNAVDDDWWVQVDPYLWAVSLDGDATVGGNSFEVDAPFSDTLDNSDSLIGLMGHVEVGRGKLSGFLTPAYSKVGYEDVPTASGEADIEAVMGWYEFGIASRMMNEPLDLDGSRRWSIHWIAGGRVTDLDIEVDLDAGGGTSGSRTWIEPFIGARTQIDVTEWLFVRVRGDVGGFGAGSDFAWQAVGLVGISFELFGADAAVFGGYRALSQDYEDGDFEWDVTAHGPLLGFGLRF